MTTGTQYGEFIVAGLLGEGGMGTVWDATHIPSGESVAIKLLRNSRSGAESLTSFEAEIRMVAKCRHPNVIRILDYGVEDGERWFAMERVMGGDLRGARLNSWNDVRHTLEHVLRGLAHAHARGITHRDLKPENILMGRVPILSDFGLAHRLESGEGTQAQIHVSAGTPVYMSPEQIQGHWRDFGPWTDLYALGCMAYELIAGHAPFRTPDIIDLLRMHLMHEPPLLVARMPVPAGVNQWIQQLMLKDPHSRMATAAEALASLPQPLVSDGQNEVASTTMAYSPAHDSELPEFGDITEIFLPTLGLATESGEIPNLDAVQPPPTQAPVKVDVPIGAIPPTALEIRRGLDWQSAAVFGLRPPLLRGFERQREVLWESLHDAKRDQTAIVVLLEGPDGSGTAPLAWWLAESAHEHAAARVFRASHSVGQRPSDGISGMLSKALRLEGLGRQPAIERTGDLLERFGVSELTQMAAAALGLDDRSGASPSSRFTTARRMLHHASRGHVNITLLDDLHLSAESCDFALEIAGSPNRVPGPALFIGIVDQQADSEPLQALRRHPSVRRIAVEPLTETQLSTELRNELRLDPVVADAIASAAGGFPEYALNLVSTMVREGDLVKVGEVWDRAHELSSTVPENEELWQRNVDRVAWNDFERIELGVVVELGGEATTEVFHDVLSELGLSVTPALWDRIGRASLGELNGRRVSVRYAPFREAVRNNLTDTLQRSRVNRAIAAVLATDDLEPKSESMLAYHLLHGGSPTEALTHAISAANGAMERRGRLNDCLEHCLNIAEHAVSLGARTDVDGERLLVLGHAAAARNSGDGERALHLTGELWRAQDAIGARALLLRAAILMQMGELERATKLLLDCLNRDLETSYRASCHRSMATIGLRLEDHVLVELHTNAALQLLDPDEDPVAVGWSHYRLADMCRQRGDLVGAFERIERAREFFSTAGFEIGLAEAKNLEGALHTVAGEHRSARACYEKAYEMMRRSGSNWAVTARLNIALASIFLGEAASLSDLVTDLRDDLRRKNFSLFSLFGVLIECAVAAELDDRRRFDRNAHEAAERLANLEETDTDVGEVVEWISNRWREHGDTMRAEWLAPAYRG